jgi:hypothetical protein
MNRDPNQVSRNRLQHAYLISLTLIVLLFAGTQYSNANAYLSAFQKVGNSLDDARLTVAVRSSGSFSEVREKIKFGASLTIPSYYLNKFFGIESKGRRIISSSIVVVGSIYLLIILGRYGVLDRLGMLFFAFLFTVSGELSVYTSTGLISYPLNITLSAVLLHILLANFDKPPSKKHYFFAILGFTVLTYLNFRTIIGVYAVALILCFGDIFRNQLNLDFALRRSLRMMTLTLLPTIVTFYLLLVDTPSELLNPYRGLWLYFFHSDYPPTLIGAASFFAHESVNLFKAAIYPHPFLIKPEQLPWVNYILGFCFLIGALASWKNRYRNCVVLFLAAGVCGHIILNLASLFPYGNLRYFLTFFVAIPIIVAMGASRIVRSLFSIVPGGKLEAQDIFSVLSAGIFLVVLILYFQRTLNRNNLNNGTIEQGVAIASFEKQVHDSKVVLDAWTVDIMKADHTKLTLDDAYLLKTNIKTSWKKLLPKELDDVARWRRHISNEKSLTMITSMPFTNHHYGALFDVAEARFNIVKRSRHRTYNFTFLKLKEPGNR